MPDRAILTGDIVKSRDLPTGMLDAVFRGLSAAGEEIARWQNAPARLTRMRGDGWQMIVDPMWLPRATMLCRAAVRMQGRPCSTRIGLGVGAAMVRGETLSDAEGPAFVTAGTALDTMRRNERLAMSAPPLALAMALPLLGKLSEEWTARQAEVATHALRRPRPTQDAIAEHLGVAQQTVQGHLAHAGIEDVLTACEAWEAAGPARTT